MEVELKGKQNMRKRAIKKWLKFKELYDKRMAVEDIARKVRKKMEVITPEHMYIKHYEN